MLMGVVVIEALAGLIYYVIAPFDRRTADDFWAWVLGSPWIALSPAIVLALWMILIGAHRQKSEVVREVSPDGRLRTARKSLRDYVQSGMPLRDGTFEQFEQVEYERWLDAAEAMVLRFTGEYAAQSMKQRRAVRNGETRPPLAQYRSSVEDYQRYMHDLANRMDVNDLTEEYISGQLDVAT
jgi:hypothetical protein